MITVTDALLLLETLATSIKPADGYLRPKGDGLPSGRMLAAQLLAASFNTAGLTLDEAQHAVGAYLAEPDSSQYPKPWPDPGKLLARAPSVRMAMLADQAAKGEAPAMFHRVMSVRSSYGPDYRGPIVNLLSEEGNHALEAALVAGVSALGGWRALGMITNDERPFRQREFVEAFVGACVQGRAVKALGGVERLRLVQG